MTCRSVFLLFVLAQTMIGSSVHGQRPTVQPPYAPIGLCEVSFHHEKPNPKYVSLEAEYVSAVPHGLFLTDRRCPRKALQIDFPDTGLDPSVALLKKHLYEFNRASGTFQGVLKRDSVTKRVYLWLQYVVNLKPAEYVPELSKDGPIQLPEPPLPKWPPGS
jgi:hypothetical protein